MDSTSRLRELIENGVQVMYGCVYDIPDIKRSKGELLGIFPDGAKEYAYEGHRYRAASNTFLYQNMLEILQKEGIDIRRLKIGSKINVDVHTLEMPNGEIYQFLLPSAQYLRRKVPRRPAPSVI